MKKCVICLQSKHTKHFQPLTELDGRLSNVCNRCEYFNGSSTDKQQGYMKFLLATKQKPSHWRNPIDVYGKTKKQATDFINYMLGLPDRTDIVIRECKCVKNH